MAQIFDKTVISCFLSFAKTPQHYAKLLNIPNIPKSNLFGEGPSCFCATSATLHHATSFILFLSAESGKLALNRENVSFSHATSVAIFNQIGAANKSEMIVVRWFKMQLQDSWL